jgi:hypothetical protein
MTGDDSKRYRVVFAGKVTRRKHERSSDLSGHRSIVRRRELFDRLPVLSIVRRRDNSTCIAAHRGRKMETRIHRANSDHLTRENY